MDRAEEALTVFNRGIELDNGNPQIRSRKAQVLAQMKQYDEALKELDIVSALAPGELNVYYRKGQIYQAMDNQESALSEYLKAMDYGNSNSNLVKVAIDKLSS